MGDVSEMKNFEAEMSEHFGDDFVKTLKKMTESNWATGKPSADMPYVSPKCKAQIGLALLFHAVYDVLHENMGQVKGPTQIAKELGLETPGSEEIFFHENFGPIVASYLGRQCAASKNHVEHLPHKGFCHKPLIY